MEALTFHPQVFPSNATIQNVTYTSSDSSVARINPDGTLITGSEGTAQITVYDGTGGIQRYLHRDGRKVQIRSAVLCGYRMYSSANGIVNFRRIMFPTSTLWMHKRDLNHSPQCVMWKAILRFRKGVKPKTRDMISLLSTAKPSKDGRSNIWSCYYCRDMTYDPETGLIYCMMATNATIYSLYFGFIR